MFSGCVQEQVKNGNRSVVWADLDSHNIPRMAINERVYNEFPANEA